MPRSFMSSMAGFDPGVILMRNTPEVRSFWRAVQETLQDTALMAEVCFELHASSAPCCSSYRSLRICGCMLHGVTLRQHQKLSRAAIFADGCNLFAHLSLAVGLHEFPVMCSTQGLQTLQDINAQNDGVKYRNAMAIMFSSAPDRWLGPGALVHFEQKYCISCYYDVRLLCGSSEARSGICQGHQFHSCNLCMSCDTADYLLRGLVVWRCIK